MDGAAAELGARPRRPAAVAAAYITATAICFFAIVAVSGGRTVVPAGAFSPALAVVDTGTVRFSAAVHPHGRATTAYFEFGLAQRYREPRPAHPVYDLATTAIHLAPAFGVYTVSGTASGLVPNALYNLRLVARSSAGTVYSPNATFRTAKDPAPSLPQIGAKFNVQPTSGLVLIRPGVSGPAATSHLAALSASPGFRPLTETRQLRMNSHIDARAGALRLVVAGPPGRTQQVVLAGGVFSVSQSSQAPTRGLTTVDLLEGDVPGAPSYTGCAGDAAAAGQTVHASDQRGRFETQTRDSSATASAAPAAWDTTVRCDATLTAVHHGTVIVSDFRLQRTVTVHAGERYLALAP